MMDTPDDSTVPESERATLDEVAVALNKLSEEALQGLMRTARSRAKNTEYTHEELLSEAIVRLLDGRRAWKRGVPLEAAVRLAMKSIVQDWWRHEQVVRETIEAGAEIETEDGEIDVSRARLNGVADTTPGVDRAVLAKMELEAVKKASGLDSETWDVAEALWDGERAADIRAAYELTQVQYDTAVKRIWRARMRLSGGPR